MPGVAGLMPGVAGLMPGVAGLIKGGALLGGLTAAYGLTAADGGRLDEG